MKHTLTLQINFRGGIISPGSLLIILSQCLRYGITEVRFGLRQQLLIDVWKEDIHLFQRSLPPEINIADSNDRYPNILSSYPAEEIFITRTWLSEGIYREILDQMPEKPALKINISDTNQSFTPVLTGNINWLASRTTPHFWHLLIRFPRTNKISEWDHMVYSNDIARFSADIEQLILKKKDTFCDNPDVNGEELFKLLDKEKYILKSAAAKAELPAFNLPYYEGFNKYNDKYWLGIYRRDERFDTAFLAELCRLCLQTKTVQLCSTPWKSIIIKNISEQDRNRWNLLLNKYRINVRHAANELNFQVEDNSESGLKLKQWLVQRLQSEDIRSFGTCIGIKTKKKSEIFSSILIRQRPLLKLFGLDLFPVYDILCARDFNPNERTGFVFSGSNPRFVLAEQLRRALVCYYNHQKTSQVKFIEPEPARIKPPQDTVLPVYHCNECLTVYDEKTGDPENGIMPGTSFEDLPDGYTCNVCGGIKETFVLKTGNLFDTYARFKL